MSSPKDIAKELLRRAGTTYAEAAGITLKDTPKPLFLREVQAVWPWVRPYFDERALTTARELGLPADAEKLGELSAGDTAGLAAALVRASLDEELRTALAH